MSRSRRKTSTVFFMTTPHERFARAPQTQPYLCTRQVARSVTDVTNMNVASAAGIFFGMLAIAASVPAHAQQAPNLVGTWKGTAQSVHVGTNPYRPSEGTGPVFSSDAI